MLEFFDRIYCINLDHRKDRLIKVKKEFEKIGLENVRIFSAIKNNDGAVGCIRSHLAIIKQAKKDNLNNVLVLEDDVYFEYDNTKELILNCVKDLPINWELFYLGANLHQDIFKISDNLLKLKSGFSTHAIAYNSCVYDKFISKYDNFTKRMSNSDTLDVWLADEIQNQDNSYLSIPLLATQTNDYSDIVKDNVDYSFIKSRYNQFAKINIK